MQLPKPHEAEIQNASCDFVHLSLDMFVPSVANMREHWAAKHRRVKAQRETALLCLKMHGKFPREFDGLVIVKLTRTGGRRLDDDNLRSAFKAVRDGVADWLGIDDGSHRIQWQYFQKPGGKKGTIIKISGIIPAVNMYKKRAERVLLPPAGSDQYAPTV